MTISRKLLAAMLVFATAVPTFAQAESLASMLADGKPWAAAGPNGRKVTLTFLPDGKVRMKMGLMTRNMTWEPTADGLCLIGIPNGDRCMRLEKAENGFVGYEGDTQSFAFTR